MMEIKRGDVFRTASLRTKMFRAGETKPALTADFSAGRGNSFVCLFLGSVKDGVDLDQPEVLLNSLGWVYDPERAQQALDEAFSEEAE